MTAAVRRSAASSLTPKAKSSAKAITGSHLTAHGEIVAIRNACRNLGTFDLSGCILYTSCEPCPMCLNACKWANIAEVYFAADRFDAENIGFRDRVFYDDDPLELHRINLREAAEIMREWKDKPDRIEY